MAILVNCRNCDIDMPIKPIFTCKCIATDATLTYIPQRHGPFPPSVLIMGHVLNQSPGKPVVKLNMLGLGL